MVLCAVPRKLIDVSGQRFHRLVAIRYDRRPGQSKSRWICRCDCGAISEVTGHKLLAGSIKSCGCLGREMARSRLLEHGLTGTPEHEAWMHMIRRCTDQRRRDYPRYGGRGISVCARWRCSFTAFLSDLGMKPTPRHSIDRINNDGHYTPENCRWATASTQRRNQRRWMDQVQKRCLVCGSPFTTPNSAASRRMTCSNRCRGVLTNPRRERRNGRYL